MNVVPCVGKFVLPSLCEVVFSSTMGMLDLETRVRPMTELDLGRMRWACENQVLGHIAVWLESVPRDALAGLIEWSEILTSTQLPWVFTGPDLPRARTPGLWRVEISCSTPNPWGQGST